LSYNVCSRKDVPFEPLVRGSVKHIIVLDFRQVLRQSVCVHILTSRGLLPRGHDGPDQYSDRLPTEAAHAGAETVWPDPHQLPQDLNGPGIQIRLQATTDCYPVQAWYEYIED
jgi:hypothetical protein